MAFAVSVMLITPKTQVVFADETDEGAVVSEVQADKEESVISEEHTDDEASADTVLRLTAGDTVTGMFPQIEGKDVATIRYLYEDNGAAVYGFADITETDSGYEYSFEAPTDSFAAVEASSLDADISGATVIAEYYDLNKWDGAVDVSWYNEEDSVFYIYTPAQFAGLSAIVDGVVDGGTPDYRIKGDQSFIESTYEEQGTLPGRGTGPLHKGLPEHDFSNKTIYLMSNLDMGGADGSAIDHYGYNDGTNQYNFPNWMPIGGQFLSDMSDYDSMVTAFFNGTFDGNGHRIENLYCYRHNDGTDPEGNNNAFCYAQGTGLFGAVGTLYYGEEKPAVDPAIRNVSLSGYVYGRRMVGGLIGFAGGGSNSVEGGTADSLQIENCANYAYVYNTDSKGIGGIIGTSMIKEGNIINCYNAGNISTNYANPCGGIVGSNEGMNIYCCYNIGKLDSHGNNRGRGIGCNGDSGADYIVDNCYYLHGTNDDDTYPGYYTANLAPSISVTVEEVSSSQVTNGELLTLLNVNGQAYIAGENGTPVLFWEAEDISDVMVTVAQAEGGTLEASDAGTVRKGTILYLDHEEETGYAFRYYTLNSRKLTGHYATVTEDADVSVVFEAVQAGVLNIAYNRFCDISVTKTGTIEEDGKMVEVEDLPITSGSALYENDVLTILVTLKENALPDNEDMIFSASVELNNPYLYSYTYTNTETESYETYRNTYTVDSTISAEGVTLLLDVIPVETQKLWRYIGDDSWYDASETEFTITTARELAGIQMLVLSGVDFSGKTIKLGNDISMVNDDGTSGKRFWDGIGNGSHFFNGTFDGQGHSITDLHVNMYGLFGYTSGAIIKDVSIYGDAEGSSACGIAAYGNNTSISNCSVYSVINGTSSYSAGILGLDQGGCSISNCFNYGSITGVGRVGGIVGELSITGSVYRCVNQGIISCLRAGNYMIGGVVGSLNGTLTECANTGDIRSAGRNSGGIAGQSVNSSASITDCYNAGTVSYEGGNNSLDSLGGIVGFGSYYKITNSFNYGPVVKASGSLDNYIGGVIGRDAKKSTNSTEHVYYNSDVNEYAVMKMAREGLEDVTYWAGIKEAGTADFANEDNVLAAINGNESFVLQNDNYPELVFEDALLHTHTGGTATCISQAVCDECGLFYGEPDPDHHGETEITNIKDPVWTEDGNTGDTVCMDCGAILIHGDVIPADTTLQAFTVSIKNDGGEIISTKNYSVAEFDTLKTTDTIGYMYGRSVMATNKYVTFESIFEDIGITEDQFQKITVSGSGMQQTLTRDIYYNNNKYYDPEGNESIVPAVIAINWTTGSATLDLETLLAEDAHARSLRLGYGITEDQKDNAPGNHLISPVTEMAITLMPEQEGVSVSGSITGYSGDGMVAVTLIKDNETVYTASVTDGAYAFEGVEAGGYTLSVSADGEYVTHNYQVVIPGEDLTQDVTIYQLGDVDMDGMRSASDITMIGRHVARLTTITDDYALLLADVTKDGGLGADDVTHLGRFVARLINQL